MLTSFVEQRHGELAEFDGPGLMLEGFREQVEQPWHDFLWENGYEWDRCYSIL